MKLYNSYKDVPINHLKKKPIDREKLFYNNGGLSLDDIIQFFNEKLIPLSSVKIKMDRYNIWYLSYSDLETDGEFRERCIRYQKEKYKKLHNKESKKDKLKSSLTKELNRTVKELDSLKKKLDKLNAD